MVAKKRGNARKTPEIVRFRGGRSHDIFFGFTIWLGYRDSNPNIQSQSLLCYRYTISHRLRMIVYQDRKDLSRFFRKILDKNFMRKENALFIAKAGDVLTVKAINASERKRNFYTSLGIFPGSEITLFMRGKHGAIIKSGKTKLALAGKATEEIICIGTVINGSGRV